MLTLGFVERKLNADVQSCTGIAEARVKAELFYSVTEWLLAGYESIQGLSAKSINGGTTLQNYTVSKRYDLPTTIGISVCFKADKNMEKSDVCKCIF